MGANFTEAFYSLMINNNQKKFAFTSVSNLDIEKEAKTFNPKKTTKSDSILSKPQPHKPRFTFFLTRKTFYTK